MLLIVTFPGDVRTNPDNRTDSMGPDVPRGTRGSVGNHALGGGPARSTLVTVTPVDTGLVDGRPRASRARSGESTRVSHRASLSIEHNGSLRMEEIIAAGVRPSA